MAWAGDNRPFANQKTSCTDTKTEKLVTDLRRGNAEDAGAYIEAMRKKCVVVEMHGPDDSSKMQVRELAARILKRDIPVHIVLIPGDPGELTIHSNGTKYDYVLISADDFSEKVNDKIVDAHHFFGTRILQRLTGPNPASDRQP
jgi:hypothetical protein